MVNKPPIGIRLPVYVIDGVQSVLEALVHSNAVRFGFGVVPRWDQRPIQFSLLVDIPQLVLLEGSTSGLTPVLVFALTDQTHPVGLLVLATDCVVLFPKRMGQSVPVFGSRVSPASVGVEGAVLWSKGTVHLVTGSVQTPQLVPLCVLVAQLSPLRNHVGAQMVRLTTDSRVTVGLLRLGWRVGMEIGSSVFKCQFWVFHPFRDHLANGLDQTDVEVLTAEEGPRNASVSDVLFEKEVVGGRGIVVPVGFETFASEIVVKAKFDSFSQNVLVNWDAVVANHYSLGVGDGR